MDPNKLYMVKTDALIARLQKRIKRLEERVTAMSSAPSDSHIHEAISDQLMLGDEPSYPHS